MYEFDQAPRQGVAVFRHDDGSTGSTGATLRRFLLAAFASALMTPAAASADLVGGEPVGGVGTAPDGSVVTPVVTAPASSGQWQVLPYTAPGLAIHATLLNDGRVLLVEGSGNNPQQFAAGTFNVWVWDPQAGTFAAVPRLPIDLFCAGHAVLPDGKVLIAGGTSRYPTANQNYYLGTKTSYVFDPTTNSFERTPDMAGARWYPSLLERGNGSILAVSGTDDSTGALTTRAELFDPSQRTWTQMLGTRWFPTYPSLTLLQDGRAFYSGAAFWNSELHPPAVWDATTNNWGPAPRPQDYTNRNQAASLLLPPAQAQQVAVLGGGGRGGAVADTDLYDLSDPSVPKRSNGPALATAKMHVLGVILPDETVFETGGGRSFAGDAVMEAAVYSPSAGTWNQMNPPTVPRTYHSEAILLPDGRVATLGSNPSNYSPEMRIEVFSPPYMFKGQRPAINAAPGTVTYGSSYPVSVSVAMGSTLSKVVLVKPASVTHSTDPNQRLVEVPFTGNVGSYTVTIPSNPNLTPPGWYMMFAVDGIGRPSVASWIRVG